MVYVSGTSHNRSGNLLGKYTTNSDTLTGLLYDSGTRNTYIGQSLFNSFLLEEPSGTVQINTTTGNLVGILADPGGSWRSDGNNGYYIYGNSDASTLTRIDALKNTATGWTNPVFTTGGSSPSVSTVVRVGSTLYICGNFTGVNGSARAGIAALNSDTGALLSWTVSSNATFIYSMVFNDARTVVYVTGDFTTIGGQTRSRLAAITVSTSLATAWSPAADNFVFPVNIDETNNVAYIGGSFSTVGGTGRACLAQVSLASTGALQAWNPSVSGGASPSVGNIRTTGTTTKTVYFSGSFTTVGGNSRSNIAAWTAPSGGGAGAITTLSLATLSNTPRTIEIDGSTLYVGTDSGATVGGTTVGSIFSANITTNAIVNAYPNLVGAANQIDISGSILTSHIIRSTTGIIANTSLFCIDSGGKLTNFRCAANNVQAMVKKGNTLYIGGEFTTVNGVSSVGLAAVDATTGALLSSSMELGGTSYVRALTLYGDTLLVGGNFQSLNGNACNGFSRVDTTTNTGISTSTNLFDTSDGFFNGDVKSIVVVGSVAYISGYFNTYESPSATSYIRYSAVAINLTTLEATSWDPSLYNANALAVSYDVQMSLNEAGTKMYIWGQLDTAKYVTAFPVNVPGNVIRVDLTTGQTIDSVSSSFTDGQSYRGLLEKNGVVYVAGGTSPGKGFYGRDATTGTLVTSTTTFLSAVANPAFYRPLHSVPNGILVAYPKTTYQAAPNIIRIFDTNTMSERY